MGLHIIYYSEIEVIPQTNHQQQTEDSEDDEGEVDDEGFKIFRLYDNDDFIMRQDGLVEGKYKGKYGECLRVGSYSYHMYFRVEICKMIGLDDFGKYLSKHIESGSDFEEFIYMSDSEGFIGPKTSEKLYNDFEKYKDQAQKELNESHFSTYLEWMEAFHVAKNNGVVRFH